MFGGPDGMRRLLSQDNLKPKKTSETLARLARYFKPYWLLLIVVALMIVGSTWAQVENPELVGQVVDCYLTPAAASTFGNFPGAAAFFNSGNAGSGAASTSSTNCWYAANSASLTSDQRISGMGGLILIVIGLFVASSVLTGMIFFMMAWSGNHVLRAIQVEVFEHLHQLSLSYYAEHEVGDLMSRITNDISTIQQAINFALINVLTGGLVILWIGYNMLTQNLAYGLISLAVVPLMAVATIWFSNQARKAFRKTRTEIGNVNAELQESFSGVREAQAFNREEENIENFRVTNAANRDANVRAVAFTSALAPTLAALGYLAMAIVAGAGGLVLLRGQTLFGATISLGLVVTYLLYVQRFNQPIQQIAVLWTNIQNAVAGAERIFGLLDIEPALKDAPDARLMPEIQGKVEFVNVSASYKKDEQVLDGVSFTAEPGQTIAIVGPTGAGKTTMINLIPRFYDVTAGAVLIDDLDVRNVTAESLRQQIGIVLQDTFLFSTSVMENIRFGRPEASDEQVIEAAKLAYADAFISRLPDGYNTVLGERGSGLSQGQRQLLAIARAALADPRILILDEATSSVDTRTERLIQKALETLLKGRTSFVIAHRLSTIRNADLVLVIDQGKIVECGRHTELLERKGFYYDLYMSQFHRGSEVRPEVGTPTTVLGGNGRHSGELATQN